MTATNAYQERAHAISQRKIDQALERAAAVSKQAGDEIASYTRHLRARVKVKTLENYTYNLSKIITDTKTPPSRFDNALLRHYFEQLAPMSNGTKYGRYQALRSFFCDYLHYDRQMDKQLRSKWERLMDNIRRAGPSKRNLSRNDHIKPKEIDQLLNACRNPRDKAFLMVLLESGARLSEILSMTIRDINFSADPVEIKIEHSKTEDKAGKRSVYLFRAAPLLRAWVDVHPLNRDAQAFLKSNNPVWVAVNGAPVPIVPNTANRILELVKKRAGMEGRKLYAHLFRHTRASDLKDVYGLDVREIQAWLGHTKIDTTSGYLTADKKRILQKLGGETDAELEQRRQTAIAKGLSVPCACGVSNDPQTAFCHRCGRVVNRQHIEEQATELQELKAQVAAIAKLVVATSKETDVRDALQAVTK